MNWLDWTLLILLAFAAFQGFAHGFIRELASLVAWVAGIWAAIHLNDKMTGWIGLDPQQEAASFLITFIVVLVGVHFLGRALTMAIDAAQLSLPNKLAGVGLGVVRKAFVLSVLLNLAMASQSLRLTEPLKHAADRSVLFGPLRAFAPLLIPALGETKWVRKAIDRAQQEVLDATAE
jgi:membrane protein required for colicin V production